MRLELQASVVRTPAVNHHHNVAHSHGQVDLEQLWELVVIGDQLRVWAGVDFEERRVETVSRLGSFWKKDDAVNEVSRAVDEGKHLGSQGKGLLGRNSAYHCPTNGPGQKLALRPDEIKGHRCRG